LHKFNAQNLNLTACSFCLIRVKNKKLFPKGITGLPDIHSQVFYFNYKLTVSLQKYLSEVVKKFFNVH